MQMFFSIGVLYSIQLYICILSLLLESRSLPVLAPNCVTNPRLLTSSQDLFQIWTAYSGALQMMNIAMQQMTTLQISMTEKSWSFTWRPESKEWLNMVETDIASLDRRDPWMSLIVSGADLISENLMNLLIHRNNLIKKIYIPTKGQNKKVFPFGYLEKFCSKH